MTKSVSKGTVRKKVAESLVATEKTAKKRSKGLIKSRTCAPSFPAELASEAAMDDGARKGRRPRDTAHSSMSQEKSADGVRGVRKEYLTSNSYCRLTFRLPKDAAGPASKVTLVGDFNKWDREASPMKKLRNGDFEATLELPAEREYRFRYLIDDHRWENDWCADKYEQNPYGCDDSVVIV